MEFSRILREPHASAGLRSRLVRCGKWGEAAEAATWGSRRIQAELAKLCITVSDSTIRKYRPGRKRANQTWATFLHNHAKDLIAVDFFTVPTATFRVLYIFLVLAHERRKVLHFNVTDCPSAAWTAQQLAEAFAYNHRPRYLLRDRDHIYGAEFQARALALGLHEKLTAPRSPWQSPFVERMIGSIRRECLDHVIVLNAHHLRRVLANYLAYFHRQRTHRALAQDCPIHAPPNPQNVATSSRSLSWAACITDTLARPPEPAGSAPLTAHGERLGEVITVVTWLGLADALRSPIPRREGHFQPTAHCVP